MKLTSHKSLCLVSLAFSVTAHAMEAIPPDGYNFPLEFYGKVVSGSPGNAAVSPYGLEMALALLREGSQGATHLSISRLIGAAPSKKVTAQATAADGTELDLANRLWIQKDYSVQKKYLGAVQRLYGADVESMDLIGDADASIKAINDWTAEKTHHKITKILDENNVEEMILTNAVYFKGAWASPFEKSRTQSAEFSDLKQKKSKSPFMHLTQEFGYAESEDAQTLELPYRGGEFSMFVLLPKSPSGLVKFERSLTRTAFEKTVGAMQPQRVEVSLPKFRILFAQNLKNALGRLGLAGLFKKGADFTGITGTKELFLRYLVQKVYVDVDEAGTEAAAATGAGFMKAAIPAEAKATVFRADHPFVFVIRHNPSKTLLFVGRVTNPKQ